MNIVEFEDVCYSYEDESSENQAVKNLSFNIKDGEFVAILGHNGSGKSTVAKLMNGLLFANQGFVRVLGKEVQDDENLYEVRKNVGVVFQNPDNQMVATIVEDDIAFGPENLGVDREEIGKRIDFALKATDMEEYRFSSSSKLSGGQKQRIAIAGVLAIKPKIIVFDESTAMLDPKGRKEVMDVAKYLNKTEKMTVIIITHYMEEAVDCDKIIVLNHGEKIIEGTPKEVFLKNDYLKSIGLDSPRATYIAKKLNQAGLPIAKNVLNKEELAKELCELLQKI